MNNKIWLSELRQFCYGERFIPLMCICCTHSLKYGLFVESKFDHQQKADILQIAERSIGYAIVSDRLKHAGIGEQENVTVVNQETESFLDALPEFLTTFDMFPLVCITGRSTGECRIFDAKKLSTDGQRTAIQGGIEALGKGIRLDIKNMQTAKMIDPNKGKIYKA